MHRARRLPADELAPYLLAAPESPSPVELPAVFGNLRPVEVEVGFGKGLFLISEAQARPDVNFLGIEIAGKYQLHTATRLAKRELRNVRVAKADARGFFRDHLPDAALQAIHVFFPDPWWKKRHVKRRVFTPEFAEQCARVLRPGGRLHAVTDVADYYRLIVEAVAEKTNLVPLPAPEPGEPLHDLDYLTNFERKFRKEGRTIHRGLFEKR